MSNDWKRGVCGCCGDPPSGQSPEDRAQRDEACCACFGACKVYILSCMNFLLYVLTFKAATQRVAFTAR